MPYTSEKLDQTAVHFIAGNGRSGTTLINNVLNANRKVLAVPENRFVMHFMQPFEHKTKWTKDDVAFFCTAAFKIKEPKLTDFKSWLVNQTQLKNDLLAALPILNYQNLCKITYLNCFMARGNEENIDTIIDKNPSYSLFVGDLLRIFPNAKCLLMVRDYRDNVLSRVRYKMDFIPNTWFAAQMWSEIYGYLSHLQQQYPDRIMVLRYEDLATNCEQNIAEVCNFFSIDYSPAMLTDYQPIFAERFKKVLDATASPELADRYDQMLSRVAEPISPQYIQGWKKKMALQDIKIAEYLCDDIGKKFGYERATTLSLGEKIQFAVRFVWVWLLTKIYLFYFKSYYRLPFAYRFRKYKHTEPIPSYS
ncbi:MAG: sulfotransferase [Chitinophagales bacterium]|nr:sulfotransferase [Chitinophagales bacterium]